MICGLLALTEITHELTEMQKSELFSPYCDLLAEKCSRLREALIHLDMETDEQLGYDLMILQTYKLATSLQHFLSRARPVITERDSV
jgi:hypothetical protein